MAARRHAKTAGPALDGTALLRTLRRAYAAEGDPKRAAQMQAYMKSAMPYHGAPKPRTRALVRELTDGRSFSDREALEAVVRTLWHGAKFREERYAALELLSRPAARKLESLESLALYEELIHTGAWWDLVDELAAHRVGAVLALAPGPAKARLRSWSRGEDLWLRRAAIIAQLRHRDATDVDFLFEVIEPAVGEKEFFLRKAIGWALRDLSRWKPDDVERWLREHEGRAAGLTVREATRGLVRAREGALRTPASAEPRAHRGSSPCRGPSRRHALVALRGGRPFASRSRTPRRSSSPRAVRRPRRRR